MPTKQHNPPPAKPEADDRPQHDAAITAHVLLALGRPGNLFGVHVRRLWVDHYRVNVLVGPDAASTRIAHSYFVETDAAGSVLTATPPIARRYDR